MKPSERQRIAQAQRTRTDVEQRYTAARKGESIRAALERAAKPPAPPAEPIEVRRERAAAELSAVRRQIAPQDLARLDHLYRVRGWPGVRQALAEARLLSADALTLAEGIVERAGLEGLGAAIEQRIQAEDVAAVQAGAEAEAVRALASLTPEQWAKAEAMNRAGGPQRIFAEAQALGLSPAAAMVIARTVESHGVDGTRQGVAERVQRETAEAAEQEASQAAIERWTPAEGDSRRARAIKEGSPLAAWVRSPDFQLAARDMAARLEAAGLEREKGVSAAEFVLGTLDRLNGGEVMNEARRPFDPRWSPEKQLETVTAILGGNAPEAVGRFLATFDTARTRHKLIERMAERDDKRHAAPKPAANPLRDTITREVERRPAVKARPLEVGNALQATIAIAAGMTPDRDVKLGTSFAERDVERAAEAMEPKPDTSLRGTIAAAIEAEEREATENGDTDHE